MYDYENFEDNFEPSIYDQNLSEFYVKMKDALKEHVKINLEYTQKQNEDLKSQINAISKRNSEISRELSKLQSEKDKFQREARQIRLKELMKDFYHIYYYANYEYEIGEKCDKCDADRNIIFKSPSGRHYVEQCECYFKRRKKYIVIIKNCVSFAVRNGNFIAWYSEYDPKDEDGGYKSSDVISKDNIYKDGMSFAELNKEEPYITKFINLEDCQKFCDYLNSFERFEDYSHQRPNHAYCKKR